MELRTVSEVRRKQEGPISKPRRRYKLVRIIINDLDWLRALRLPSLHPLSLCLRISLPADDPRDGTEMFISRIDNLNQ